jgi:hypothetical protein
MKKLTANLLILLLLLNVLGYYGIFMGIKYQHTTELSHSFDESTFNQFQTITIKIPLAIPYYSNTDFERVDGEIEHNGEFYRLVKQKYEKDTLHIVCVRDFKSESIKQALTDYVKTFSEHSSDGKSTQTAPSFIKDYISTQFQMTPSAQGWKSDIRFGLTEKMFISFSPTLNSPPPEFLSGLIS